jgi:hypothetical protein
MSAVFLLSAEGLGAVKSESLEDFEQFTASTKAVSGKFAIVEAKEGVTQGRQALLLQSQAAVVIPIKTFNVAKLPWLKVDAFVGSKASPAQLQFYFTATDFSCELTGLCLSGQDTLALPLSAVPHGQDWPDEGLKLTLTNLGPSAITVDNIRLEEAEPAPPGTTLVAFGPKSLSGWPGFSRSSSAIDWSGKNEAVPSGSGFPDPLTGHFVAPSMQDHSEDYFSIESPSAGSAWLWVSHYGRTYVQPPEYYMKVRGQVILAHRFTLKQLLGAEGLQTGIDGDWTPQWMEKTYVPRVVELVQVPLQAGKNQVDVCNIQLSAVAMGPASSKHALELYVGKVKEDLARYRRQFVLGQRVDYRSEIQPTDAEVKAGAMLFGPPRGSAALSGYLPKEDSRLKTAQGTLYNGGLAQVWLAAVPLKKTTFTGSVSPLRSADGKALGPAAELWFIQRVPYVANAQASMIPYILCRRLTAAEREVVHLAVVVQAPGNAAAGDYSGTIRLNAGAAHAEAPITVHVLRCGSDSASAPTFGVMGNDLSEVVYGAIAGSLDPKKKGQLELKLRQEVQALGFDAAFVPSCGVTSNKNEPAVYDEPCREAVRALQPKTLRGRMMVDLSSPLYRLAGINAQPGGSKFDHVLTDVIAHSNALMTKAGFTEAGYCGAVISDEEELAQSAAVTAGIGSHARACVYVYDSVLTKVSQEKLLTILQSASVLLVRESGWTKYMDKVDAFKKAIETREYYGVLYQPEEYGMGFRAWGQGAKGWYYTGLFDPTPYRGFGFYARGLLAPDADLSSPCLPMQSILWMRQGMSDFTLASRAEALVKQAQKSGADCAELQTLLDSIRKDARGPLAYIGARGEDLEKKRVALMEAAAKVSEQLKK